MFVPAQMKHNSDKMIIAPKSSQPCSKPDVSGCIIRKAVYEAKNFDFASSDMTTYNLLFSIALLKKELSESLSKSGL